jgi:hypothetical protein
MWPSLERHCRCRAGCNCSRRSRPEPERAIGLLAQPAGSGETPAEIQRRNSCSAPFTFPSGQSWLPLCSISRSICPLVAREFVGTMVSKLGANEASGKLDPLTEVDDMTLVAFPCHPSEPLKILDDWRKPVRCGADPADTHRQPGTASTQRPGGAPAHLVTSLATAARIPRQAPRAHNCESREPIEQGFRQQSASQLPDSPTRSVN